MSSIKLSKLTKNFGDFTAVNKLDLDIHDGAFVALLGPSGCGKTTTMNLIAGIETPTSGEILFDGEDLSHVRVQDRKVGFVFQNYAIFTHLSVFKNLSYGLEVRRRLKKDEIKRRVIAMAHRMNIGDRLDQHASSLSVNELQKLAIGRSAITEPKIFLLDEPLSNVDAAFRAYMRAELKVLQHELGQTMIYVTHDQVEAMSLADKIAVMNDGVLQQYGTPLDVYNDPHNVFVANFIGSPRMNLIDGGIRRQGDDLGIRLSNGVGVALDDRTQSQLSSKKNGHRIVLGVRPQDVVFEGHQGADAIEMNGKVDVVERVGPSRIVHIDVSATEIRATNDQGQAMASEHLRVFIPKGSFFLFDGDSGARIYGDH